ncbi:MAG: hypothetical protein P8K77_06395 [Polaribacter sp.]|nr:hypothetical protein [Polaribacter sp.]
MQKISFILSLIVVSASAFSQKKADSKKAKDSIKTEVINVVTSYTPTISDAFKIKKNPTIHMGTHMQKKKLQYQIFSAPVASTFIPKTGIVKRMSMGKKEQIYNNYIAAGFGNNTTPFFETFLHHSTRFKNEFGFYAKYISSKNGIETSPLNNDFSNLTIGTFYKQEERSYSWKVGTDYTRNQYNWYGLPISIPFSETTLNAINQNQTYSNIEAYGNVIFKDLFLNSGTVNLSYFSDNNSSKELSFTAAPQFQFSLKTLGKNFNDLIVDSSMDYLNGKFTQTYSGATTLKHHFLTFGIAPKYNFKHKSLTVKLGTKVVFNADLENKIYQFFIYPDINISFPIIANYVNFYVGANGNLKSNSYKELVSENPYLSPTQFITQTNEKYNVFGGFNGKLSSNINYDIKASYSNEDDKALFIRNNSKSDGSSATALLGYEFGNSFSVIYDDVKTFSIFAEVTIDVFKNFVVGANGQFNYFTLTRQFTAWNTPKISGEIFGDYKINNWYAGANVFFVGDRKDLLYSATFPSTINKIHLLKAYLDVNINGGYHINKQFTAFLKLHNILNSKYQRFSNFTVQGFQVLGGVSYKFDF